MSVRSMMITRSIQHKLLIQQHLKLYYHRRNLSSKVRNNQLKVWEVLQSSEKSNIKIYTATKQVEASSCTQQRLQWIEQQEEKDIDNTYDSSNDYEKSQPQLPLHKTMQKHWISAMIRQMLPYEYPHSVDAGYRNFALYQFIGATSSSAACVLSTQCLLHAVGLTSSTALGLSAALNWVIKDGLGQVGGILFASYLGNSKAFDSDPKKW